jgi:hypothetical protein
MGVGGSLAPAAALGWPAGTHEPGAVDAPTHLGLGWPTRWRAKAQTSGRDA